MFCYRSGTLFSFISFSIFLLCGCMLVRSTFNSVEFRSVNFCLCIILFYNFCVFFSSRHAACVVCDDRQTFPATTGNNSKWVRSWLLSGFVPSRARVFLLLQTFGSASVGTRSSPKHVCVMGAFLVPFPNWSSTYCGLLTKKKKSKQCLERERTRSGYSPTYLSLTSSVPLRTVERSSWISLARTVDWNAKSLLVRLFFAFQLCDIAFFYALVLC